MTLKGFDTATPQASLDFSIPKSEGYTVVYVKMGGNNVHPRYVAPHYHEQIDKAIRTGMKFIGHYYVPDRAEDPEEAANFVADNLYRFDPKNHFLLLDNEGLDGKEPYTDAQQAAFNTQLYKRGVIPKRTLLQRLFGIKAKSQLWNYLGLDYARNHDWSKTLATGVNILIAAYSYAPFGFSAPSNIPMSRIKAHQFSSTGKFGGVTTDLDAFRDDAFAWATTTTVVTKTPTGTTTTTTVKKPGRTLSCLTTGVPTKATRLRLQWYAHLHGYTGPIDGDLGTYSWKYLAKGLGVTITSNLKIGSNGWIVDATTGRLTADSLKVGVALQRKAQKYGYAGPLDGKPEQKSWQGIAKWLNTI